MAQPNTARHGAYLILWLLVPLAGSLACLADAVFMLRGPFLPIAEQVLVVMVAVAVGAVGLAALGMVVMAGVRSFADGRLALSFQGAGWLLGFPLGWHAGFFISLYRGTPEQPGGAVQLLMVPLLAMVLGGLVWSRITAWLTGALNCGGTDYACAWGTWSDEYAQRSRRRKAARAARHPDKITPEEAAELAPEIVPALGERLRKSASETECRDIIRLLRHLEGDDVCEALLNGLKSKYAGIRKPSAVALGRNGCLQAMPALASVVLEDEDAWVRRSAIVALGKLGDAGGLPALTGALNDDDPRVRASACVALGRLGSAPAADLVRQALTDPDEKVREAAGNALRKLGVEPGS